jgi:hypothetical protein
MIAKCTTEFMDLEAHTLRKEGETFEVSKDRFEAINATRYGKLVEEAEEAPEEPSEAPERAEKPKRGRKAKED